MINLNKYLKLNLPCFCFMSCIDIHTSSNLKLKTHNHFFFLSFSVPGNIHSGVSGNDSIIATGVFSAKELLRVTRRE